MMNRAAPQVKQPGRPGVCPDPLTEPARAGAGAYFATGEVTMSSTSQSPSTRCMVSVTWSR